MGLAVLAVAKSNLSALCQPPEYCQRHCLLARPLFRLKYNQIITAGPDSIRVGSEKNRAANTTATVTQGTNIVSANRLKLVKFRKGVGEAPSKALATRHNK